MPKACVAALLAFVWCSSAFGQAAERLTFDVSTIKPFVQPAADSQGRIVVMGRHGGPGTADPGRINWAPVTLRNLIMIAYDVKTYQVTGPAWLNTQQFEIIVKVPAGATTEQVNIMWQNLLADRFGVVLHRQPKEFQVDELVVAKGGSKLKETTLDPSAPPPEPGVRPLTMENGVPKLTGPGLASVMTSGPNGTLGHLVGKAQTVAQLCSALANQLNRPVLDKTDLAGKYDFVIEYTPDVRIMSLVAGQAEGGRSAPTPGDSVSAPGSSIVESVQQLGLRLSPSKAKLDVLIIDKAEKTPTEN